MKRLWLVAFPVLLAGCASEQIGQAGPSTAQLAAPTLSEESSASFESSAQPAAPILSEVLPASNKAAKIPSYTVARTRAQRRRADLAAQWKERERQVSLNDKIEQEIVDLVQEISAYWLGTRWGLGAPQTSSPHVGKINCGTFVGTVLRDVGFNVNVKKLQRQPSQLIIASFVSGGRVKKFSNRRMDSFLATVKRMGPGLFIIGLDFHVGFLIQTEDDLRFIHASYETQTVVDEPAAAAIPITTSGYRVVGKLLTHKNMDDWLRGKRILVKGKW